MCDIGLWYTAAKGPRPWELRPGPRVCHNVMKKDLRTLHPPKGVPLRITPSALITAGLRAIETERSDRQPLVSDQFAKAYPALFMKHRSENVEMDAGSVPRRTGPPEAYVQYVEDVQAEKCAPGGHICVRSMPIRLTPTLLRWNN